MRFEIFCLTACENALRYLDAPMRIRIASGPILKIRTRFMQRYIETVNTLIESFPYIRQFYERQSSSSTAGTP
jgi:hypothetical protein